METNVTNQSSGKGKNIAVVILAIIAVLSVVFCVLTFTTDIFGGGGSAAGDATLVLYEGPKFMESSSAVSMKVDGNDLFVYETAVNNTHTWRGDYKPETTKAPVASFDFDKGAVNMEITVEGVEQLRSAVVRPLKAGITPKVSGNTISFDIAEPGVYVVEYDGSSNNVVNVFANAIDYDAPTASDDTVRYIGPGAWSIETMTLTEGMQLYISGGAIVQGVIKGDLISGASVSGHGYIDGSNNESWELISSTAYVPIDLQSCSNVNIKGIALLDSNAWCLNIYGSTNINVDGIKIMSARPNGDGITVQSSKNVTVSNSFVRTWDDTLVVKNYSAEPNSDSDNIRFSNCLLWTDLAQSMEIGYETNKGIKDDPVIKNISFSDITVLHNFHKPVISIHNSDNALVKDITYTNIIVEDASMGKGDGAGNNQLIDFNTLVSSWSVTGTRGTIDGVKIDGVYVIDGDDMADGAPGNFCSIRMEGYNEESLVKNVTVNNLFVKGEAITDANVKDNVSTEIDKNVENITFTNDGTVFEDANAALEAAKTTVAAGGSSESGDGNADNAAADAE